MREIKRIPLEGVHNTRDLGGYPAKDGSRIKPRSLIRSGELFQLTEKDKETLTGEYRLSTIVDFRTEMERDEKPDPDIEGVTYIPNPILEERALGITREEKTDKDVTAMVLRKLGGSEQAGIEYMESMYRNLISNDFCKKQYASFFRILLKQETGALLWHCTAGKDRAGAGTALLLSVLGVSEELILEDYMKVNEFAADGIRRTVEEIAAKSGDERLAEQIRTLFSVRECYLETMFAVIKKGYGSTERYLEEEMGMGTEEVQTLKHKYMQPWPSGR